MSRHDDDLYHHHTFDSNVGVIDPPIIIEQTLTTAVNEPTTPRKRGRKKKDKTEAIAPIVIEAKKSDKPLAYWLKKREKLTGKLENANKQIARIGQLEIEALKEKIKQSR